MRKYKVIWFDDEYQQLGERVLERAHLNDVELIGYANAKEGIEELERNIRSYDAAIVDGIFFSNNKESGKATSDKPLLEVSNAINRLSSIKVLPWFILSGQSTFTKEKNRYADGLKDNVVYDKLNDDDLERLWIDIKKVANKQIETQIRNDYSRVFDVCQPEYIGKQAEAHLLTILQNENQEKAFIDSDLYFTPLRKAVEDLFTAFNKHGFLPEAFVKPTVALNESSRFLSGEAVRGYQLHTPVFMKPVSDLVKNILSVCQPAAHRSEIENFINEVNSAYLLLSVTYQLMDVLLWFKIFVDKNRDVVKASVPWKQIFSTEDNLIIAGFIEKDSNNNYHCKNVILTYKHLGDNKYKEGDRIRVVKTFPNTNIKTSHLYPLSAIQSERVQ